MLKFISESDRIVRNDSETDRIVRNHSGILCPVHRSKQNSYSYLHPSHPSTIQPKNTGLYPVGRFSPSRSCQTTTNKTVEEMSCACRQTMLLQQGRAVERLGDLFVLGAFDLVGSLQITLTTKAHACERKYFFHHLFVLLLFFALDYFSKFLLVLVFWFQVISQKFYNRALERLGGILATV